MINIVVISHGLLAQELLRSASMIAGDAEGVYSLGLQPGDTPEDFGQKLDELLQKNIGEETLILIDILSGTPYNLAAQKLVQPGIECITGVNLAMLLEAILGRSGAKSVYELAAHITEIAPETIKNLRPLLKRL